MIFEVYTLISRTFRRSSLRRLSLIGRPLTELDGSDDKLPCLRRLGGPRNGPSCIRFEGPLDPNIFRTSPYLCVQILGHISFIKI